MAELLSGVSMLLLPLIARDVMLGFFVCVRRVGFRRFDAYDIEIGMEFAARAAIFMDNAQRYSRERATALTLQRSMLPTGLSAPSSVEVKHRYLPGSKLIEVGGDWYESIALPGGRVALVVGDVAGHGVRAAVTMGRLRTAIHTLAMLELPPAETLQQLNELMQELGVREPHFATCVYAIFDAVAGTCEVASAGHLPPLLVRPDGTNELLDVMPAPPLGVGTGLIQSRVLQIEDGSLLVLYTDGLVEKRGRDIDEGLGRLRDIFGPGSADQPLEDLCRATLAGVYADQQRDDIALLVARLRRIPPDHVVSWTLPSELTSASRARSLIRRPLRRWGLTDLIPTAELLVSELVTNAVRYAQGKIGLRLVLEGGLVCEVLDDSAALPRLRHPDDDDERGRGLQVVSQLVAALGRPADGLGQGRLVRAAAAVHLSQAVPPSRAPGHCSAPNAVGRRRRCLLAFLVSSRIDSLPFCMMPRRCARRATELSCVTTTIVSRWSRHSFSSRPMISSLVPSSRFPVGSSASSTLGSLTSALAMATRCCWPPDSSDGRCRARSARPTSASAAAARSRRSAAGRAAAPAPPPRSPARSASAPG